MRQAYPRPARLIWARWAPAAIVALGITLRVSPYVANRSLWLDELALALNIVNRSFSELVRPLDYNQGAPLGFLMAQKLVVLILGNREYALRLVPLAAGVASMFLFYALARRILSRRAALLSLVLFALSGYAIYYASEVKQYSSDLAIALLLLNLILSVQDRPSPKGYALLALAGATAVWLSHPAAFVLAGGGTDLALHAMMQDRSRLRGSIVVGALWACSFIGVYALSLSTLTQTAPLLNFWQAGFMPLVPRSYPDLKWFVDAFFGLFDNPGGLRLAGLAAFAFVMGVVALFVENKRVLLTLTLPILLVLLASGLHRYPFSGRLILWTVPSVLLLVAQGVEQLARRTGSAAASILFAGLLCLHPALSAYEMLRTPPMMEETRTVISHVQTHRQPDDLVYVYYGAKFAYLYYAPRFGLDSGAAIMGSFARQNRAVYADEIRALAGNRRVWFIFSHVDRGNGIDEEQFMLLTLNAMGKQLDAFQLPGASAYLYNLSANAGTQ